MSKTINKIKCFIYLAAAIILTVLVLMNAIMTHNNNVFRM